MIRAGIYGASGYTGSRLAEYLSRHGEVEIAFATSRKEKGRRLSDLYGELKGLCDIEFSDPVDVAGIDIDVLFTCAPDQTSMKVVPSYLERGVRVVDLAGDYRMDSAEAYTRWYNAPHDSPDVIDRAVYGLSERNRENIAAARLVANPGCYPTSVLLACLPLLERGLIEPAPIHVTSMSGISGAGRGLSNFKLFYETDSNVLPYKHGRSHKHVGEIEQELAKTAAGECTITFAPHVVPQKTGIVSTIVATLANDAEADDIGGAYREAYDGEFFVRFDGTLLPESKFVADTNFCDIGFSVVDGSRNVILVSAICNLGKGASGQAVQNMNIMFGFGEREGLV